MTTMAETKENFYALLPKSYTIQDCRVGKITKGDFHSLILIHPLFCICPELLHSP